VSMTRSDLVPPAVSKLLFRSTMLIYRMCRPADIDWKVLKALPPPPTPPAGGQPQPDHCCCQV